MRRGSKPVWLTDDESGKFLGINLGADFVSEHEWGIKNIRRDWGIIDPEEADKKMVFGSKRYRISRIPIDDFKFVEDEKEKEAYLIFSDSMNPRWRTDKEPITFKSFNKDRYMSGELRLPDPRWDELQAKREKRAFIPPTELLAAAWDEGSFGVHVKGVMGIDYLKRIYKAFLNDNNICIFCGGTRLPAFENAGLQLVIATQIPQKGEETLHQTHVDHYNLRKAADATGIADRLKKAGCRYFALSPNWKKQLETVLRDGGEETLKTEREVIFWLNPMEQDRNNHGWYTVEQLDEWIAGTGPIPKKQAQR